MNAQFYQHVIVEKWKIHWTHVLVNAVIHALAPLHQILQHVFVMFVDLLIAQTELRQIQQIIAIVHVKKNVLKVSKELLEVVIALIV